jgi:hypothetical protein
MIQGILARVSALMLIVLPAATAAAEEGAGSLEVRVSVDEQRLVVLRDGMWTHQYRISTSKFGLGDRHGSYRTPLGKMRVCEKIGHGLPHGAVIRRRHATGEILPVNAPGRDPIVTRILWLEGLEQVNANARARGIYIHGTVEESKVGQPVSYGCIRMRSRDVIELFDALPVGTPVTIQSERLPRYRRWTPPLPSQMIAAREPAARPVASTQPMGLPSTKVEATSPPAVSSRVAQTTPTPTHATTSVRGPQNVVPSPIERVMAKSASRTALAVNGGLEAESIVPADPGAAAALKGSILFSDIPAPGETEPRRFTFRNSAADVAPR